jgi:hypothetical protein
MASGMLLEENPGSVADSGVHIGSVRNGSVHNGVSLDVLAELLPARSSYLPAHTGASVTSYSLHDSISLRSQLSVASEEDEAIHEAMVPNLPPVQAFLAPRFHKMGRHIAAAPYVVLLLSIMVTAACMLGLMYLRVDTEPMKLWVSPHSRAAQDKSKYDADFGPFYRIEQLVLSTVVRDDGSQPSILTHENIELVRFGAFVELVSKPAMMGVWLQSTKHSRGGSSPCDA